MAFALAGLKPISFMGSIGNGAGSTRQLFTYVSNDDAATVEATGYFASVAPQFTVGDIIAASLDLDGTPVGKLYLVSAASKTAVTIKDFDYT